MDERRGLAYGFAAYLIWGCFPLYFPLLKPATGIEILAHRMVWSAVTCAILIGWLHRVGPVREVLRNRRQVTLIGAAATLIAVNWGVYVVAVNGGQVVEAAMGYYINPLVTVLLGVLVLREGLRRLQWTAVGIGAAAVAVLTGEYGHPPWIALTLAASFATYSLVKNRVGRGVDALTGLTVEAGLLTPIAVIYLTWLQFTGSSLFHPTTEPAPFGTGIWHLLMLVSAGAITVTPLLFFAGAARRIPLSTIGLLQYLTPTLQFLIGVLVGHEPMSQGRWIGFGLVWLAVACLVADVLRHADRGMRRRKAQADLPAELI